MSKRKINGGKGGKIKYSFLIPVHNEQGNLDQLMAEIEAVRKKLNGRSEVVLVNDASSDNSGKVLARIGRQYRGVVVVTLAKNSGQSAATVAGLDNTSGEYVITLDADLQNNPADLAGMQKYCGQYDVVVGRRAQRRDSLVKRISSRIANGIRNRLNNETISDTGCSLRIVKASILKKVPRFNGMHRFIPTLCRIEGATVREVDVSHRHRQHGTSHYGTWNRAFRALADAIAVRWFMKRKIRYLVAGVRR